MDPEIIQLRCNLNTFTLAELKKEVIKMKADKFAVTPLRRHQVIDLILTHHSLFSYLKNKAGSKRRPKPVTKIHPLPASIKIPPELLYKLANQPNP